MEMVVIVSISKLMLVVALVVLMHGGDLAILAMQWSDGDGDGSGKKKKCISFMLSKWSLPKIYNTVLKKFLMKSYNIWFFSKWKESRPNILMAKSVWYLGIGMRIWWKINQNSNKNEIWSHNIYIIIIFFILNLIIKTIHTHQQIKMRMDLTFVLFPSPIPTFQTRQ